MIHPLRNFAIASVCITLISCNEGSNGINSGNTNNEPMMGSLEGEITSHGEIEVRQLSNQGLDFHAVFLSMNAPFEASMLIQEYEMVQDSCKLNSGIPTYFEDAFTLRTDYGLPDSFGGYTTISAGDVINFVNSDETIFWSLYKFAGVDFTRYSHDTDPYDDQLIGGADVIPDDLKVDIPGDVFPGFRFFSVPDAEKLVISKPDQNASISASTEFFWEPSKKAGGYIRILATNLEQTVDCDVIDDGEFLFPDHIREALGAEFSANDLLVARTELSLYKDKTSSLLIKRTDNYIHSKGEFYN